MSDRVFEVEDTCILTEDVERDFGTVPKGTIIEIMEKYAGNLGIHYDAKTLACSGCSIIVTIHEVSIDILQDHDDVYPPIDR